MKNRTLLTIALALFAFGCADDPALGGPTGPDPADTFDVSPVDFADDTTDDTGDETGDLGMDGADLGTLFDVLPDDPDPLPGPETSAACCFCVSADGGATWSNACTQIVGAQPCDGIYFPACEWVGGALDCPEVCA